MGITYKWQTPFHWLEDYIDDLDAASLRRVVLDLARVTDFDTIQDVFEGEMDDDGYFKGECPECGEMEDVTQLEDHGVCRECVMEHLNAMTYLDDLTEDDHDGLQD